MWFCARKRRVEDVTADVVKVHVNVIRGGLLELGTEIRALVVDGGIEAKFLDEPAALLVGSRDSYNASAVDLGDLARDASRGASGARDHDCLAGLGLADAQHAEVRRERRAANGRQVIRRPRDGREIGCVLDRLARQDGVLRPASHYGDDIALLGLWGLGCENTADCETAHLLADFHWRYIGAGG